ncbi:unnamed protein product, partial [Musa textilis]
CGDCAGHGFQYFSSKKTLQEGGKRSFNLFIFVALTEVEVNNIMQIQQNMLSPMFYLILVWFLLLS